MGSMVPVMKRGLAIGLVIGWLLGTATWVGYSFVTGGSYEYRVAWNDDLASLVNNDGWEVVSLEAPPLGGLVGSLRRPKIRMGR